MDFERGEREAERRGEPGRGGPPIPIRTWNLTSFWLYILGPIVGGVLAALLYDRTMAETEAPA